jgi:hypothetical protein
VLVGCVNLVMYCLVAWNVALLEVLLKKQEELLEWSRFNNI